MKASRHPILSATLALMLAVTPGIRSATAATYSNGTSTATILVTATILANCVITTNPLVFGSTGVLSVALNQQTTMSVTCSNTTPYNLGLDAGIVTGSTVPNRLMAGTTTGNTGTTINFELYQDSAHTTIWGNTQGTNTVPGTGSGTAQTITIYGQIPAQTTPKPDTYQTTITATAYF